MQDLVLTLRHLRRRRNYHRPLAVVDLQVHLVGCLDQVEPVEPRHHRAVVKERIAILGSNITAKQR
jgi:hypothetical protein